MANEYEYDVIVVGASNAGGFAACAAAELGAKVLVIDKKADSANLYRHWIGSVDSNAQKKAGVKIDKNDLIQFLTSFYQDNVDQKLLWQWINSSGPTLDWLDSKVLKKHNAHLWVEKDAETETLINKAFPTEQHVTKDDMSSDLNWGRYVLQYAEEHGAVISYNTKLEHLIKRNNRIVGIVAKDTKSKQVHEFRARKAVILCSGGYGANEALVQKWAPTLLKKCVYTQSPRDDGSGIVAALEIGALKDEEPASIIFDRGPVVPGTNITDTYLKMWNVPQFVLGSYPMLKVNIKGKRFFNESAPYQFAMNSLMHQPGNLEVEIFDEATLHNLDKFHTLGCSRLGWPGIFDSEDERKIIDEGIKNGLVQKADNIEELAQKLLLSPKVLTETVKQYNQFCATGVDEEFGKEKSKLIPVKEGPFYGVTIGGDLLATLDGIKINEKMQVLNKDYCPIKGLYAAGNCSGGFFWGSYPDRVPGLTVSHAITFGRIAGKNAVKN